MPDLKLSIVTVTYNRAEMLKECLESILESSRNLSQKEAFEHIIVDGMSNDQTKALVNDYINKAPYEVNYIREPDKGIYDAMNKGIRNAKGKWLNFVNSDDLYLDDGLSTILSNLRDGFDIIAFNVIQKKGTYVSRVQDGVYDFPHQGTLIRRAFLLKNGMYNTTFRVSSDLLFNCKYYKYAKHKIVNKSVVRMGPGGISSSGSIRSEMEFAMVKVLYSKAPIVEKIKIIGKFMRTSKLYLMGRIKSLSKKTISGLNKTAFIA